MEPVFNDALILKLKRIVRNPYFSDQFKTIIKRYKSWILMDIMRNPTQVSVKIKVIL